MCNFRLRPRIVTRLKPLIHSIVAGVHKLVRNVLRMDRQFPNRFWMTPDQQLGFQDFSYRRAYVYPPRLQDEYVVVIPLAGEIHVHEDGRPLRVNPGEVLIGNSRHWRGSNYGEEGCCHGLTLIASRRFVQSLMLGLGEQQYKGSIVPVFSGVWRTDGICPVAEDVLSELANGRRFGRDYLLELRGREILLRCIRLWPNTRPLSLTRLDRVLSRRHYVSALDHMQSCGKAEFSVVALSRSLGLSPEEFTRLFRKSTGTTPLNTYNRLLIDRATRLFQSGVDSVKEVAATLQFDSVSHFSSLYKKLAGRSPTAAY